MRLPAGYVTLVGLALLVTLGVTPVTVPTAARAATDTTAPGAPANLNGFPRVRTATNNFTIIWDNPTDESGIAAAYYRFEKAPTSNTDGTRIAPVSDPGDPTSGVMRNIALPNMDTWTIYVWLEDGAGLIDYTTAATTILFGHLLATPDGILRTAGDTRYTTSVKISQDLYPHVQTAGAVVLANGASNADALAGVPLAYLASAPILLIKTDEIPLEVAEEIVRVLGSPRIYLLGGTSVISQALEDALRSFGYDVKRLAGSNRIATTLAVVQEVDLLRGSAPTGVYLVNGFAPADALSAAPAASFSLTGIAMTGSGALPQSVQDYLSANSTTLKEIAIVGGTGVVAQSVEDNLRASGLTVTRIGGTSRYETSRLMADLFLADSPTVLPLGVGIVNGNAFADALPAGVHLGSQLYPLLLVPNNLDALYCSETYDFMVDHSDRLQGGFMYGGEAVLAPGIQQQSAAAIAGSRIACGQT